MPTGLTLDSATGQISGIPTTAGFFSGTIQVQDSSTPVQTASVSFFIIVTAPPQFGIATPSLPTGIIGTAYNASLIASNGTQPYVWSVTAGALPTGLTLNATGQISGIPTTAGTFTVTIQVQDSATPIQSASRSFNMTVTVPPPFAITTLSLPAGIVGTAYNASLAASNGTLPYVWSVTVGFLPSGLTLNTSGQISGIPTAAGTFAITIQAQDSATPTQSASKDFSITISTVPPPPAPTGLVASPGNAQVTLTWNAVTVADSYNLYRAEVAGVSKSNYTNLAGGVKQTNVTSPFIQTGLSNGTTYYFVVTAVNANGESAESVERSATPAEDTGGTDEGSSVSAGLNHTCARLENGTVQCWGNNGSGQLGNGTNTSSNTPVQVSGISTATSVAAGSFHTCARLGNGTVQCWGNNTWGQLGNGTNTSSNTPVQVSGISTATSVSTGTYHSCAVLGNGTIQCWGINVWGQLGNGTFTSSATPVQVSGITTATSVSTGVFHTCAVLGNGTVQCWGNNGSGQLGNDTNTSSTTPVQVSGITTATAVSAGWSHTCARLGNGTVQCWGNNGSGQLGNGTSISSTTPVQVSGISTATSVSTPDWVGSHSCARLGNGTVQCWGNNAWGQLGNDTNTSSATPVQVSGISTATAVSVGSFHTCSRLENGTVQCWGNNVIGQLGNGTTINSTTPVQVSGLP